MKALVVEKNKIRANLETVKERAGTAQVIAVLNLAPRKIRGLMSNGMVLTAEKDGKLSVLTPAAPVPNGSQIA